MEKEKLKTGTTLVGVVGKDSVILAADKRVTLAGRIVVDKKFNKILQVNDYLIVAMSGSVSDAQLLTKYLRANLKLNELKRNKPNDTKESVNFLSNIIYGSARQFIPAIVGFLVAGRDESGVHLYEVGIDGSIIEYTDYTSDGSGMMYATGTMEANYKKGMTSQELIKLAVQAVNSAMQRDAASGNGVEVYQITKDDIKKVFEKEVNSIISV
ncbi:proteasome subunit beta [Candidatus Woesearchaeota archaeon]|nr:proteasome subunit beta [Candidatus Woesearchaeota archaeon]